MEAFKCQAHTMYWSLSTDGCAWLGSSDPPPTGSDTWRLPVCLHHSDYEQTAHSYLLTGETISSLYNSYVFSFPFAIIKPSLFPSLILTFVSPPNRQEWENKMIAGQRKCLEFAIRGVYLRHFCDVHAALAVGPVVRLLKDNGWILCESGVATLMGPLPCLASCLLLFIPNEMGL